MAVSKDDILETISNMSVMEVVDLISAMEEKFGVSAAAAVAAAPAAGGDAGGAGQKAAHLGRFREESLRNPPHLLHGPFAGGRSHGVRPLPGGDPHHL